jgi:hypothetical protein
MTANVSGENRGLKQKTARPMTSPFVKNKA